MTTLAHPRRIEECGICYDQFEWISLANDKNDDYIDDGEDISDILSALEQSSLEERYDSAYRSTSSYSSSTRTSNSTSTSTSTSTRTSTSPSNSSPSYSKPSPPSSLESQGLSFTLYLNNPFGMFRTPEPKPKPKPKTPTTSIFNSFNRPTSSRRPINYDSEEVLSLGTSMSCNEGHLYCFVCIEKYLEGQMKDGMWPILCPDVDCKSGLAVNIVESILGAKAVKWHQLGVEHAVKKQ
ncbi:hypothetical protein BGZ76_002353, partial [Entomortierella beljakovae]